MAGDRRGLRPRDHRLHDAPVLPDPLDHARRASPRSSRAWSSVGLTTSGACGDITRNVVGCTLAGIGHDAGRRRPRHRRGDPRVLPRQQALLEPPAQVQDLRHRLPRGLRARPDQRRRALGRDPRGRHARASTSASAAASPARRASRAGSTSSSRPRRRPRSSPAITAIFRDSEENRAKRGQARLKFLVDRDRAPRPARGARAPRRPRAAPRRPDGAPDLRGHDHIGVTPQTDGEHSRGRLLRPGRAPARRPAARARPARPRVRDRRPRSGSPTSRTCCCRGSRTSASTRCSPSRSPQELSPAARRCSRAALQTCTGKEFCGLAKVHTKDRAAEIATFLDAHVHAERPRRGLPPALRGLLVELRAAPDRRRRHRGRAQEGRRRVRRGDGHPHRRPARARPALRRRRAQEGPELGAQRDAAADLHASTRRTTPRARRSATSRAAPSPSGGPSSSTPRGARARPSMTAEAVLRTRWSLPPPRWLSPAPSRRRSRSSSTGPAVRGRARRARVHDRHRRAVPGDATRPGAAFEERYGIEVEVSRRGRRTGCWDRPGDCCGDRARCAALERALSGARRLDHRASAASSRRRARTREPSSWDEKRGLWKFNPLVDWTEQRRLGAASPSATCPTTRCTTRGTPRSAARPARSRARGARAAGRACDKTECGLHVMTRTTSHSHLESRGEASTSCARSPPSASARRCCSAAARTRSCCCGWPRRRSAPGRFPFPLLHVDTGHNFPEVLEFRDRRVAELGEQLLVASVQESIDAGRVRRGDRPARVAQPPADARRCSTRSRSTASTPASAARGATRSARAPRSA